MVNVSQKKVTNWESDFHIRPHRLTLLVYLQKYHQHKAFCHVTVGILTSMTGLLCLVPSNWMLKEEQRMLSNSDIFNLLFSNNRH